MSHDGRPTPTGRRQVSQRAFAFLPGLLTDRLCVTASNDVVVREFELALGLCADVVREGD